MSEASTFESRIGKIACDSDTFYSFTTDIRNFRQFIPDGTTGNLIIEKESCSFNVSMLGTVKMQISEKLRAERVVFSGNAMQINDFQLIIKILKSGIDNTDIRILLSAEMNPFLKMVAAEPIKKLLEAIVVEMEKFRDWNAIKEQNQSL